MKTGTWITIGVVALLGIWIAVWAVGVSNSEKKLYLLGKAQEKNCQIIFDKTWKTITGQAGVLSKYKDDFKEVYVELMNARYKNNASAGQQTLMKWVTENHIPLDASLYNTLMNTISGSRDNYNIEQQKLIDIDLQHKKMRATFPNSLIVGNRPDIGIKLITSAKTEEVYTTGQENDGINPFEKKEEDKK